MSDTPRTMMQVMEADGYRTETEAMAHMVDFCRQLEREVYAAQAEADRRTREVELTYGVQMKLNARIADLERNLKKALELAERWIVASINGDRMQSFDENESLAWVVHTLNPNFQAGGTL